MSHVVEFPRLGLTFTVNEVAFSIGSYQVRWYGIIIAVGFLLAVLYASLNVKKMNINMNQLLDAVIVGLIGSVICARLYYVVFYPGNKYWENPMEILKIHEGGLAIYGGLIGALVFGGITAKIRKLKVPAVLDIASLGFLIGQCIGRWGNFVNQEAFGTGTTLPWGMFSDNTELVVPGSPVHPCFLYESLLCLLGFILLHFFNRKGRRYDGQTFLLYIVWYGACRFFIEGIRTDSLMLPFLNLRVSQVLAAGCVIVGFFLLFIFRHKTSLTGCGSAKVMEGVGITTDPEGEAEIPENEFSTIFGDIPAEELSLDFDEKDGEKEEESAPEDEQSDEKEQEDVKEEESETEAEKEQESDHG